MIAYFFSACLAVLLMYGLPVFAVWLFRGGHDAAVERVRTMRSITPDECPACGSATSWHQQGCGLLDQLDAVRR